LSQKRFAIVRDQLPSIPDSFGTSVRVACQTRFWCGKWCKTCADWIMASKLRLVFKQAATDRCDFLIKGDE
jgi:hypothetical protein